MKRALCYLLLLLSAISLSSCKLLFKTPVVEKIHDVKVSALNPDKTELEISISVKNPNCYALKLNEMNVELLTKDREKIGTAKLKSAVEIPKRKSNALNFTVSLDTRPTVKMINHSDQKVFFYIGGKGIGRVWGIAKRFEFEEPYELSLKEHLEALIPRFSADGQDIFQLKRSYVEKLGVTQTLLKTEFIILNPYGLSFRFQGFPASILINGKEAGTGDLEEALVFDEKVYSREGAMHFKVSNFKSVIGAVKGAFKGEISYEVKGNVVIEAFGLEIKKPYSYKGLVPVSISDVILN